MNERDDWLDAASFVRGIALEPVQSEAPPIDDANSQVELLRGKLGAFQSQHTAMQFERDRWERISERLLSENTALKAELATLKEILRSSQQYDFYRGTQATTGGNQNYVQPSGTIVADLIKSNGEVSGVGQVYNQSPRQQSIPEQYAAHNQFMQGLKPK